MTYYPQGCVFLFWLLFDLLDLMNPYQILKACGLLFRNSNNSVDIEKKNKLILLIVFLVLEVSDKEIIKNKNTLLLVHFCLHNMLPSNSTSDITLVGFGKFWVRL